MPPSSAVKQKAAEYITQQISDGKLPKDAKLGKSSRYYLVKLKYDGIKEIEMFGLTSFGKKGLRSFGWVLLEFGNYGVGGRGGIISLSKMSEWLNKDLALYSTYIKQWDAETNVELYVPLTKYENIKVEKVSKNSLKLVDKMNKDCWMITRGSKEDDFGELVSFINSKK